MRRFLKFAIIFLILAGVGFTLFWFLGRSSEKPLPYKYEVVRRGDVVLKVSMSGNLVFSEKEVLYFRASGYVDEVLVEVGDRVKKGNVLAKLYTGDLERMLADAKRRLRISEIGLEKLLEEPDEGEVEVLRAKIKYLEAEIKKLKDEIGELEREPFADPVVLELKEAELYMKEAELLRTKEELSELLRGADPKDIEMKRIEVELASSDVEEIEEELEGSVIRAPFDGVISEIYIEEGTWVKEGMKAIVIADPESFEVEVMADEIDAVNLKEGQEAKITFDTIEGLELSGYVERIYPKAEIRGGVVGFKVIFKISGSDPRLKEGLSCLVDVVIDERRGVLVIPNHAVRVKGGKKFVFVLKDGEIKTRFVKIGLRGEACSEVLKGLEEGEKVVVGLLERRPRIGVTVR